MTTPSVLYARVSSAEQLREGYSIPAQVGLMREFATRRGMTIEREFQDDDSGGNSNRPGFLAMLDYLRQTGIRAVIAEKIDRMYRNYRDPITLEEMGATVYFAKDGTAYGPDAPAKDKLIHDIMLALAKNYLANLSEEVKKGMRQKCAEGGWPTWAPLGYTQVTEPAAKKETGGIVPDPDAAPIVRELFDAAGDGASLGTLARIAAKAGLRGTRGGTLGKQQLSKILRAPVYYGETRWGGVTYLGKYEPLIDRETFERAGRALANASKPKTRTHTFTYQPTCGDCGGRLTGERKKGKFVYYSCRCSRAEGRYYAERTIDEAMHAGLSRLALPPESCARVLAQLGTWHDRDTSRDEVRVGRIRRRLTELGNLQASAYEEKLLGKLAEDAFATFAAKWRAEESELRRELMTLQSAVSRDKLIAAAKEPLELVQVAARQYLRRTSDEKGSLVKTCVQNLTVSGGSVVIRWASPFDLMAKLGDCQSWLGRVDEFRTYLLGKAA